MEIGGAENVYFASMKQAKYIETKTNAMKTQKKENSERKGSQTMKKISKDLFLRTFCLTISRVTSMLRRNLEEEALVLYSELSTNGRKRN